MKKNNTLYDNYTTTSSLVGVNDIRETLSISDNYLRDNFLKFLPSDLSSNILEVGCGYGRYLLSLKHLGYLNIHGIDFSLEQINYGKNQLGVESIELADAIDWLENKNCEYDCIMAIDIFEHLQLDELVVLTERIYRSLKIGGRLIVQVPNGIAPFNPIIYGDITHLRAFTPRSLNQLLLNAGFDNTQYLEVPPSKKGIKGWLQVLFWRLFFKPFVTFITRLLYGKFFGGYIFSSNFIGYAVKA